MEEQDVKVELNIEMDDGTEFGTERMDPPPEEREREEKEQEDIFRWIKPDEDEKMKRGEEREAVAGDDSEEMEIE